MSKPNAITNAVTDEAFSYQTRKDGKVVVMWYGKPVITLKGKQAEAFLRKVTTDPQQAQRLMAKVTGNFKRGNERG